MSGRLAHFPAASKLYRMKLTTAGLGHETKANTYKVGTEKAYHHFNRALDYFTMALKYRPNHPRALLARSKVLITLAMNYQPPRVATASLSDAVRSLYTLVEGSPSSVSARETLAQACTLLSSILHQHEDAAEDAAKTWEGQIGRLAREALRHMEDVAADKMDRMREMKKEEAAQQAPAMAETFLALSSAAITVSSLATDIATVDEHIELAEQALDQASNMATVAAAARVKSSSSSANLITRIQLASGQSSLERLRHTFILGRDLDEDDFRSLMSDMTMLATECRERAAKLKGSKGAVASTLAWEAVKQLADAKVMYASLLRLVWRKRRPAARARTGSAPGGVDRGSRKLSVRADSMEAPIIEEDEDEKSSSDEKRGSESSGSRKSSKSGRSSMSGDHDVLKSLPVLNKVEAPAHKDGMLSLADARRSISSDARRDSSKTASRKGSHALESLNEGEEVSTFSPSSLRFSSSGPARRGSWLPESPGPRSRRLSSMNAPLTGPDGISAWTRKASVISLDTEEEAAGLVPSAELALTAWQLLDNALKQYKLALSMLSGSDLPSAQLARAKADTLFAIAYSSLFMASLSRRVAEAHEKRSGLLVTSEVYSTWAAREVGWSFLIEGTKEAASADRRTNSWRADESGKRAVMLLLRTWWHRAVTTATTDVDTKASARDAVEVVVRRMRDREGVKNGDIVRFRHWLVENEGDLDPAEALFWRSVSRILRGGAGFVMS